MSCPQIIIKKIVIDRNKKNRDIEIEKGVIKVKQKQAVIKKTKDINVNKRYSKRGAVLYFVFIF